MSKKYDGHNNNGKITNNNINPDNKKYHAEYGAELSPERSEFRENTKYNDTFTGTNVIGYLAILSSIISFFAYPVTFGIIGIVLGIIAINSNAKTLGYWAVGLGLLTSIASLFFRVAALRFILNLFR